MDFGSNDRNIGAPLVTVCASGCAFSTKATALWHVWLTFGGCGAAVLAAAFPSLGIGFLGVSVAFGLSVLTIAYAVGHISGGHLAETGEVFSMPRRSGVADG